MPGPNPTDKLFYYQDLNTGVQICRLTISCCVAKDETAQGRTVVHWHGLRIIMLLLITSVGQALVHSGGLPLDLVVLLDLLLLSLVNTGAAWGALEALEILQERIEAVSVI